MEFKTFLYKLTSKIDVTSYSRINTFAKKYNLPKGALVGFAVQQELQKEEPFKGIINLEIPEFLDIGEFEGIKEAQIIVDYLSKKKTINLEYLILLKSYLKIGETSDLLKGISRALKDNRIELKYPDKSDKYISETWRFLKFGGKKPTINYKTRKEVNEYELYRKLQEKFKDVE